MNNRLYISDSLARVLRTLIQMIAAGAFTAIFDQVARDAPDSWRPYVAAIFMLLVVAAQNSLEQNEKIPTILKPANSQEYIVRV